MKNTKWTISTENDLSNPFGIIECDGVPIACVLQKGVGREQAEANAQLIAVAPELLEQLVRLRGIIANYYPQDGDDLDIVDEVIGRATKGVSK